MDLSLADFIVFDVDTASVPPFSPVLVDPQDQLSIDAVFGRSYRLPLHIPAKSRALLSTQDIVEIPEDICGLICLRSTYARLGFISPPTIADPGFQGTLTMELFNASNHKILLRPGDKVWSMMLLQLVPGSEPMYGGEDSRYQGQSTIQLPKAVPGPTVGGYVQREVDELKDNQE